MTAPGTPLTAEQQQMVTDNLGLCGWVVNTWFRHLPLEGGAGYTQEDARQDAVFGLMRAVQKYDPETGHKFSTYASTWLRQTIGRGAGVYEGINYRRVYGHRCATDAERAEVAEPVLSLDLPTDDEGFTLLDSVANTDRSTEPDSGLTEAEAMIRRARRLACRDRKDRLVFDDWLANEPLRVTAARLGVSTQAVGSRRRTLARRARSVIGDLP